jgi:hypothetical protein
MRHREGRDHDGRVVAKLAKVGFADVTAIVLRLYASNSVAKLEAQWTLWEEPA